MKHNFRKMLDNRTKLENLVEVTFFVPCYNEEKDIITTLNKVVSVSMGLSVDFEILIYNDGSSDKSKNLIEKYINDNSEVTIRVVNNKIRRGLGYNYISGAFRGLGKYCMMICGDNSETEESMIKILEKRGMADIIIPYFANLDTRNPIRRVLSRSFTQIVNFCNGHKIKYYNGTVLHKRDNIMRWHPMATGFAYQAEILGLLLDEGKSYIEVMVSNSDREIGFSRAFNLQNILSITHSLLQIIFRRIRKTIWPI